MVLRFDRSRSRRCEHRLQRGQPDQFQALAQLASDGLIPALPRSRCRSNIPVPFRDYLGTARLDWAQSSRSQWFLRAAADNYTTQNDFVQQGTLPSTGATSHSNYMNMVIEQSVHLQPHLAGLVRLRRERLAPHRSDATQILGFALAFPFSSTSSTISGFETFGDNQFVTPITAFPGPAQPGKVSVAL